ncbi:hypothetical protein BB559_003991 [Furculomyces boomerangus]|uniref:PIN domain-containing protein n=1 Tax=Furculomyces boomerangus TaxID=61424 RepID=A0A2T9YHK1_9FUNG|nr:hypothetical protein BB559_003991 [Furculomyces boomerangus]
MENDLEDWSMDIDSEEAAYQIVNEVNQYRSNKNEPLENQDETIDSKKFIDSILTNSKKLLKNKNDDTNSGKTPSTAAVVVVDTNYLISFLNKFKELVNLARETIEPRVEIIVPWVVLGEIDNLHKSNRRSRRSAKLSEETNARMNLLHNQANKAIEYLCKEVGRKTNDNLRGQTIEESLLSPNEARTVTEDDIILDCCRYFMIHEGKPATLLTMDRNLTIKARVHGSGVVGIWNNATSDLLNKVIGQEGLQKNVITTALEKFKEKSKIKVEDLPIKQHRAQILKIVDEKNTTGILNMPDITSISENKKRKKKSFEDNYIIEQPSIVSKKRSFQYESVPLKNLDNGNEDIAHRNIIQPETKKFEYNTVFLKSLDQNTDIEEPENKSIKRPRTYADIMEVYAETEQKKKKVKNRKIILEDPKTNKNKKDVIVNPKENPINNKTNSTIDSSKKEKSEIGIKNEKTSVVKIVEMKGLPKKANVNTSNINLDLKPKDFLTDTIVEPKSKEIKKNVIESKNKQKAVEPTLNKSLPIEIDKNMKKKQDEKLIVDIEVQNDVGEHDVTLLNDVLDNTENRIINKEPDKSVVLKEKDENTNNTVVKEQIIDINNVIENSTAGDLHNFVIHYLQCKAHCTCCVNFVFLNREVIPRIFNIPGFVGYLVLSHVAHPDHSQLSVLVYQSIVGYLGEEKTASEIYPKFGFPPWTPPNLFRILEEFWDNLFCQGYPFIKKVHISFINSIIQTKLGSIEGDIWKTLDSETWTNGVMEEHKVKLKLNEMVDIVSLCIALIDPNIVNESNNHNVDVGELIILWKDIVTNLASI